MVNKEKSGLFKKREQRICYKFEQNKLKVV